MEDKPHKSGQASSVRSKSTASRSSTSNAAARARAVAEAARARASFAERELAMKKEKARLEAEKATLEATLEALQAEKEAAAAQAEAEILEAAAEVGEYHSESKSSSDTPLTVYERTNEYVEDQSKWITIDSIPRSPSQSNKNLSSATHDVTQVNHLRNDDTTPYVVTDEKTKTGEVTKPAESQIPQVQSFQLPNTHIIKRSPFKSEPPSPHSNNAPHQHSFVHAPPCSTPQAYPTQAASMTDFAKYLARRELVTTGLTKFDDQPENYRAWQASFINVIEGLDLTAGEELDLLAKWLGKESSEYVKRFRSVHINNPKLALQMVWDRLNQCYAAPEIVESALFSKLDNFPRISNKDNSKLRELGDLLLELRSAKEDGYLPGLTYLDTARGINPIVDKLPHNLQEKWVSIGSRYKDEHYVSFPPFSFFTQFVCCEARIRNWIDCFSLLLFC